MKTRKETLDFQISDFPERLHPYLDGAKLYDFSSHSTARVLYADTGYFVKMDQSNRLGKEYRLAKWFETSGLGVPVLDYFSEEDVDYLVTKEAEGCTVLDWLSQPEKIIPTIAVALKKLHQSEVKDFPGTNRLEEYKETVKQQYLSGNEWRRAWLPRFGISSREQAWQIVEDSIDLLTADSLIHGDACFPNIILKDTDQFSCFIDVGLAGLSDKHIDIFWTLWSLQYNLGDPAYGEFFLDCYGRDEIDEEKLRLVAACETFG